MFLFFQTKCFARKRGLFLTSSNCH